MHIRNFEHLLTKACKLVLKKEERYNKDIEVEFSPKHKRKIELSKQKNKPTS